mmetsp:Transcript_15804/g.22949  ORF Transcript_15804/g.22949 Transcript_15804/m.22949 type:complete len:430 (-) Transcript_15804:211-1500(-)
MLLSRSCVSVFVSAPGIYFSLHSCACVFHRLAYHYTVLPLGYLIIAMDPHNQKQPQIDAVLQKWSKLITIDVLKNDTWITLKQDQGWQASKPFSKRKRTSSRTWNTRLKNDLVLHRRRQEHLFMQCQRKFKDRRYSLAVFVDSDEYVTFNHEKPPHEDHARVGPQVIGPDSEYRSWEEMVRWRDLALPFRRTMPRFQHRVTLMDYIHTVKTDTDSPVFRRRKCYRLPALQMSGVVVVEHHTSREPSRRRVATAEAEAPSVLEHPEQFVTTSLLKFGTILGSLTKCMLDMTYAEPKDLEDDVSLSVHLPNHHMCGLAGRFNSGNDYISAPFRFNHYPTGTLTVFMERSNDLRGTPSLERFTSRNAQPYGEGSDLEGWIEWFVDKIGGKEEADYFLFRPMDDLYKAYQPLVDAFKAMHGDNCTNSTVPFLK